MAYQSGLDGDAPLSPHIESAADFLVSHGPSFGVERWEEQSRLLALDDRRRDRRAGRGRRRRLRARRRRGAGSTVPPPTTSSDDQDLDGHHQRPARRRPLLHPAVQERRPEHRRTPTTSATAASLPTSAASSTRGFLELTRLGELPAERPGRRRLLGGRRLDARTTPNGPATTATAPRRRAPTTATATATSLTRRLPGERHSRGRRGTRLAGTCGRCSSASGPSRTLAGDRRRRRASCCGHARVGSGVGLVPEQAWEDPDLAGRPVRQ